MLHQQADDEADVGATAFDDARRRRRAVQGLGVAALDHGTHVLQYDEAARALREAVAGLLADDLVLLGLQPLGFRVGHRNGLDRNPGLIEERCGRAVVGEVGAGLAARVAGHLPASDGLLGRRRQLTHDLSEVHLLRIGLRGKPLALAAEQLTLEPLDLAPEFVVMQLQRVDLCTQPLDDLPRPECGYLRDIGEGGRRGAEHCHNCRRPDSCCGSLSSILWQQVIALVCALRLDAFEHQLQARVIHLAMAHPAPVGDESPRLEPLCPQAPAAAVKVQNFDVRGASIDEGEQVAVERILPQAIARQRVQPVERFAHVCRFAVQVDANIAFREEHQPRTR